VECVPALKDGSEPAVSHKVPRAPGSRGDGAVTKGSDGAVSCQRGVENWRAKKEEVELHVLTTDKVAVNEAFPVGAGQ